MLSVGTRPESETAMASSSGAEFEIHNDDGGHKSIIRAPHPKSVAPGCTDRAKYNPATADEDHLQTRSVSPCCSGAESCSQRSWYYSARIQRMIDGGALQCENETSRTESEIEASKVHWSEVVDSSASMSEAEQSGKTNREYFEVLQRRRYVRKGNQIVFEQIPEREEGRCNLRLFDGYWGERLVVGEKLAEGGQAEIYAATFCRTPRVVKVFKGGSVLQHLEEQIPPALLKYDRYFDVGGICGATLLTDERFKDRFAFVMDRCWGDLRKLVDDRMMRSSLNAGPPFSTEQLLHLMGKIAEDMHDLHRQRPPILHNDLKTANVLVQHDYSSTGPRMVYGLYRVDVADFECSVGVVGTGFWRAPEILQQLKDRVPVSDLKFTKKCDVYSYGMTCYELVTGRIPFEDYTREGYELVLKGDRPELPPDLDPFVKRIITSCWHPNPSERPSFKDIAKKLQWKILFVEKSWNSRFLTWKFPFLKRSFR